MYFIYLGNAKTKIEVKGGRGKYVIPVILN